MPTGVSIHNTNPPWTDERVDLLRYLAEVMGFSSGRIANEMGISRNSVMGKLKRKGIALRPKPRGNPTRLRLDPILKAARQAARVARSNKPPKPRHHPGPVPAALRDQLRADYERAALATEAAPEGGGVTFRELQWDQCRWPSGDPGCPGFCYCGAPHLDGESYCIKHWLRAHRPPPVRVREAA